MKHNKVPNIKIEELIHNSPINRNYNSIKLLWNRCLKYFNFKKEYFQKLITKVNDTLPNEQNKNKSLKFISKEDVVVFKNSKVYMNSENMFSVLAHDEEGVVKLIADTKTYMLYPEKIPLCVGKNKIIYNPVKKRNRVLDQQYIDAKLPEHDNLVSQDIKNKWMLYEGTVLFDLLNGSSLNKNLVKHIMLSIVSGVQHLHKHGLAHRNLKPENILINPGTGQVRITGFDLLQKISLEVSVEGTPAYMAPELCCRTDCSHFSAYSRDDKTDIWSMGVILYELLSGESFVTRDNSRQHNTIISNIYEYKNWDKLHKSDQLYRHNIKKIGDIVDNYVSQRVYNLQIKLSEENPKRFSHSELKIIVSCLKKSLQFDYRKRVNVETFIADPFFAGVEGDSYPYFTLK